MPDHTQPPDPARTIGRAHTLIGDVVAAADDPDHQRLNAFVGAHLVPLTDAQLEQLRGWLSEVTR